MCLAIPGKIIEIEGNNAVISYGKIERTAKIIHGDFKIGDRVIVSNKIIVEKIND